MKRIISIILLLSLCLTLLPLLPSQAADISDLSYEITDGEVTIRNCSVSASGTLTIPATIDGYPVTSIGGSAFYDCRSLSSITLPDSLTSIGDSAFFLCTKLSSITLPDSLTSIGDSAFSSCLSLRSITLPDSLTSIGDSAFSGCISLRSITLPDSLTSIGKRAFSGCASLHNIYFSGNSPEMDSEAFYAVTATASYHTGAEGWTDAVKQNYGGIITWIEEEHIYENYTPDNNYTCTADGTKRAVCTICGRLDVQVDVGSARHRMQYTFNNDATCTEDGTKTGVCLLCSHTETVQDIGSATGHSYGDYYSNQDATCTANGTKSATCQNCGDVKTMEDLGSAMGHSFTNYISNGNYSCTIDGTKTAKCDYCEQTDTQVDWGSASHRYVNGVCIFCGVSENNTVLTGTLTTWGDGEAVLTLLFGGETIRTLTVSDGIFTMDQLTAGDYVLWVTKDGCVPREYELTLSEGENLLDFKLYRNGDITGDGNVNMGDVSKLYAHIKGTSVLTDENDIDRCDVTGDSNVNMGDVSKLYAYIKGTSKLY